MGLPASISTALIDIVATNDVWHFYGPGWKGQNNISFKIKENFTVQKCQSYKAVTLKKFFEGLSEREREIKKKISWERD